LTQSVLKNKQALFAWVADERAQIGKKKLENTLRPLILDQDFWTKLNELADILKPIHEAQKMSESNNANLAKVVPRWLRLEQELKNLSQIYLYLKPILAPHRIFNTRLNAQTGPIHWAAFVLDPTSSLRFIDAKGREQAIKWIIDRVENKKVVHASLQDFQNKENSFTIAHLSNLHIDDPIRY
jgi:hypothetical protein